MSLKEEEITAALRRSARRAHLIAHLTGTKVVSGHGDEMEVDPDPEMYKDVKVTFNDFMHFPQ